MNLLSIVSYVYRWLPEKVMYVFNELYSNGSVVASSLDLLDRYLNTRYRNAIKKMEEMIPIEYPGAPLRFYTVEIYVKGNMILAVSYNEEDNIAIIFETFAENPHAIENLLMARLIIEYVTIETFKHYHRIS